MFVNGASGEANWKIEIPEKRASSIRLIGSRYWREFLVVLFTFLSGHHSAG